MVHRIRAASLSKYAEVARRAGLDPPRMLSEFGLPPRCLEEPELRVPLNALRQLLEASAARSGVEAFGLIMAEARLLSDLGRSDCSFESSQRYAWRSMPLSAMAGG